MDSVAFNFVIQSPRNSIGPDIQHFILGSEGAVLPCDTL